MKQKICFRYIVNFKYHVRKASISTDSLECISFCNFVRLNLISKLIFDITIKNYTNIKNGDISHSDLISGEVVSSKTHCCDQLAKGDYKLRSPKPTE